MQGVFSSSGAVDELAIYGVYGKQTISTGAKVTPFGFQGSYSDQTGLIYLINRYYDPTTDQFLSIDPDVTDTVQPYVFTNDDPLNATDSLGLAGNSAYLEIQSCKKTGCKGGDFFSVIVSATKQVFKGAEVVVDAVGSAPGVGRIAVAANFVGGVITIISDNRKTVLYTTVDVIGGAVGGAVGGTVGAIVGGTVGAYDDSLECGGDPVCAAPGAFWGAIIGGLAGSYEGSKLAIKYEVREESK